MPRKMASVTAPFRGFSFLLNVEWTHYSVFGKVWEYALSMDDPSALYQ